MKLFTFLFLLVITMTGTIFSQSPNIETGVSQELAKWRSKHYSDVRYKLNITLEKGAPLMKGDIEIRVNLTDEGAKNDLILDWRTTQFANDKDKPFANVVAVNEMTGAQAARLHRRDSGETAFVTKSSLSQSETFSRSALIASEPLALQSNEHLIIPKKYLKTGENVLQIKFASPIKTSGAAITRYVDKEDGAEYVYSLFVPSDASTAFPVFDQPDLKARFKLNLEVSLFWKAVSNTQSVITSPFDLKDKATKKAFRFEETKPISTYVFAFAAGDFVEFEDKTNLSASRESGEKKVAGRETSGTNIKTNFSTEGATENESWRISDARTSVGDDTRRFTSGYFLDAPPARKSVEETNTIAAQKSGNLSTKIYVRKSQAEKFKQHSAEVFRLNREGVKFLEDWFDYKFPFPKYDLVLIPEFPFGGMEHAGATFLREDRVIFPTEPTKNDYITRANVIFHEAAHQWFGDTVTMKWFDDLWLKEGFAEFMAYKTLEKVLPEYNAWKVFYERNKQAAYLTDVTRGTTPIYQEIPNLASAKSAYGNIVYRKAPSFLRQAEFYLGEKEFQTAVRAFLKKHEFANAEWTDLVSEFETASKQDLKDWANVWVKRRGLPIFKVVGSQNPIKSEDTYKSINVNDLFFRLEQKDILNENGFWRMRLKTLIRYTPNIDTIEQLEVKANEGERIALNTRNIESKPDSNLPFIFPNYQDYGYGIFLLDEKSRAYVLANIQNEKDDFLRSMMWGSLWDSVRFYELAPEEYVRLVIKNINVEQDESTIATLLNRVSTAMNYYLTDAQTKQFASELEKLLIEKMQTAPTLGQKITFYRAFVSTASTDNARNILKNILSGKCGIEGLNCRGRSCACPMSAAKTDIGNQTTASETKSNDAKLDGQAQDLPLQDAPTLKTKDKFDIVTKLIILGDKDAPQLLANLEKQYTDDAAKRYAYAARAGIATAENKAKYWKDFTENKEISESWIESAFAVWNSPKHSDLTLKYLEKSLAELPNLKRNRKIFFVNGWLSSFIGGQKSAEALNIVNKFLNENPNLDKDLRNKILENADNLERAVKIREKFGK